MKNRDKRDDVYLREREKWLKKICGEYQEELVGECTMPGCKKAIYDDTEFFKDDSGNIFCSFECVFEWYGIRRSR